MSKATKSPPKSPKVRKPRPLVRSEAAVRRIIRNFVTGGSPKELLS